MKVCIICGVEYEEKRKTGLGTCASYSCKSKRYYRDNIEQQKQRCLSNYYKLKKTDIEKIRAVNRKAKQKIRFGREREEILKRDGYKCKNCNNTERLVVHHKDNNGRNTNVPNNDIDNLVTVCASCHAKHHFGHSKLKV